MLESVAAGLVIGMIVFDLIVWAWWRRSICASLEILDERLRVVEDYCLAMDKGMREAAKRIHTGMDC